MKDQLGYFRQLEGPPFNLAFYCPGCECNHGINTDQSRQPAWQITFSKDNKPTTSASVLVKHGRYTDKDDPTKYEKIVCHLFIREGKIEFLNDCTHALVGKTVDMQLEEDQ